METWSAVILGIGVALGGFFIGTGFYRGRATDRIVTVKGISERDVEADVALWPLRFVATHDNLREAQSQIKRSHDDVMRFLESHGIAPEEAEVQQLEVTDVLTNPYRTGPTLSRYIIEQTIMVRTSDPAKISNASQAVGELVDAGVILSSGVMGRSGPTYLFTNLSDLKPEMIAEATAQARRAAEQFAQDSGSRIGKIRRANQGVFVILARDRAPGISEESQLHKTVRVVSTVEYYLKD
ncbi:hypothetical protein AMJ82_03750 [candidate division TA06 bacterium SM23_40]|uniref:SIMPL domain-containing protein n=1 Tax=candidate division TA06 bacterium SM23_40 TaxID=1703774 RepID=A0A0S8GBR8_UNCT6|nr:MAG: hypothetical protein AMJ82_03750 [candidate division TA06 bacterium SM23_40]